jgi:hypothetical protein
MTTRQMDSAAARQTEAMRAALPATEEFITVRDFAQQGSGGRPVYLPTFQGRKAIGYIRWPDTNPWAVNTDGLASWCVFGDTRLYFRP